MEKKISTASIHFSIGGFSLSMLFSLPLSILKTIPGCARFLCHLLRIGLDFYDLLNHYTVFFIPVILSFKMLIYDRAYFLLSWSGISLYHKPKQVLDVWDMWIIFSKGYYPVLCVTKLALTFIRQKHCNQSQKINNYLLPTYCSQHPYYQVCLSLEVFHSIISS